MGTHWRSFINFFSRAIILWLVLSISLSTLLQTLDRGPKLDMQIDKTRSRALILLANHCILLMILASFFVMFGFQKLPTAGEVDAGGVGVMLGVGDVVGADDTVGVAEKEGAGNSVGCGSVLISGLID